MSSGKNAHIFPLFSRPSYRRIAPLSLVRVANPFFGIHPMLPFPLFLALKYLKPKRNFASVIPIITIIGVMLGVAILMIVLAVMTGFGDAWREKILSFKPHITVYHRSGYISDIDSACTKISAVKGVVTVCPTITTPVMIRYREDQEPITATVIGIDPDRASILSKVENNLTRGEYDIQGNRVLIGVDLASRLRVPVNGDFLCYSPLNLKAADQLYFPEEMNVAGVYNMGMRDYDDFIIIASLGIARDIIGADYGAKTIQVQINNPDSSWEEAESIQRELGPDYLVNTWYDEDRVLFNALRTEKTMMFILLAFIAIVAAFCVTNTLIVITIQKTKEIGLLKALGFSPLQLKLAFVLNGQIQCVGGILLGLVAGYTVLVNLQNLVALLSHVGIEVFPKEIYGLAVIPWRIVPFDVISVVATVFLFCTVAGYLPAWRAANMDPVKAINQE